MQVREFMTHDPETCLAADSCGTARSLMQRRACAVIPIVESHATKRVIGVVTDQDIARHLERVNRPAHTVPVEECMRNGIKIVAPDTSLEEAVKLMKHSVSHCLAVVEDEQLVGVLSPKELTVAKQKLGEMIRAVLGEREREERP